MDIQEILTSKGLTQNQLAKMLGITQAAVSHMTTGKIKLPPYRAMQIEKLTNGEIKASELINING